MRAGLGKTRARGGADKLGHAFSSYAMTNLLADRLEYKGRSPEREIGNDVIIGPYVAIVSTNHSYENASTPVFKIV